MTRAEVKSLHYCQAVTRAAKSSFPLAFWVLPRAKRQAMLTLYAFFRLTDDLADQPGEVAAKRLALRDWRTQLDQALSGTASHPIHPALRHTVDRYQVPVAHLHEVIDGVEMDLEPVRIGSFAELYGYCYRVASAVGLSCIPIWGYRSDQAKTRAREPAEYAGIAFQLTNILRDLGEDLAQGRVYLPQDELQSWGCPPESWRHPDQAERFQEMMRFQVQRAKEYYRQCEPLADFLSLEGRAIFAAMEGLYRRLLQEIEARNYDVFTERVRLNRRTKIQILLRSWPVKWGWL